MRSGRALVLPNMTRAERRSRFFGHASAEHRARRVAEALDVPGHRVRVVAQDVGGGFGGKGSLYPEEIFVCAAARRLSRSIKWTSDRMEDLLANSQGFDEIVDAEIALDDEARVLALRAVSSAMSAPIRFIHGRRRLSRSKS